MEGFLLGALVAFGGVALGAWVTERWWNRLEESELQLGQTIVDQQQEIKALRSSGRDASSQDLGYE